jgi:hypothetical protein
VATNHNPEKGRPRSLNCEAWEAMLADALDGTLSAGDAEAFAAHSQSCGAGCGELLEEAKRGTEWLRFLRETPEAPEGLLEKILVGTSGLSETQLPLAASGAVAIPHQPWLGVSVALLQRHVAESRILMTLAMAFFSLALTLNLTGVRLNQLKLSDLSPSALAASVSHEYYTTYGHLNRYYSNLRIVYELTARVNEIRNSNAPAPRPAATATAAEGAAIRQAGRRGPQGGEPCPSGAGSQRLRGAGTGARALPGTFKDRSRTASAIASVCAEQHFLLGPRVCIRKTRQST